jgi:Spy/CpxP family protein refolding chaperone
MIRRIFIAAALTALFASLAPAQGGGGGGRSGGGGGGQMGGGGFGRGAQTDKMTAIANSLKLSADQKAAFEAIMDEAQKQTDPLVQQVINQRNAILQSSIKGEDTADATKKLAALNVQRRCRLKWMRTARRWQSWTTSRRRAPPRCLTRWPLCSRCQVAGERATDRAFAQREILC